MDWIYELPGSTFVGSTHHEKANAFQLVVVVVVVVLVVVVVVVVVGVVVVVVE